MLKSLIHLDLSFLQGGGYASISILLPAGGSYACTICWRCFFIPIVTLWFLCQKSGVNRTVNLHQGHQFDSLIHLSVFMPIPCYFYYYSSVIELEVRNGDASGSSFTVQDYFSYPGVVCLFVCFSI